jgi:hypothetical protein
MEMIDVLKRLAELDAKNPNIVKENASVAECGIMPEMSAIAPERPHTPATVNISADSGEELSSMLRDIMTLAGRSQPDATEPDAMSAPVSTLEPASPDLDPSTSMRSVLDKLNPDDEEDGTDDVSVSHGDVDNDGDHDMNDHDKEKVDEYDNEPNPETTGYGSSVPSGNDLHKEKHQYPAAQRGDNAMAATYESLMSEYKKFIGEDQGAAEGSLKQKIKTTLRKLDPTIKGRLKNRADDEFDFGLEKDNGDWISGAPGSAHMKHAAHLRRIAKGENPFQDKKGVAEDVNIKKYAKHLKHLAMDLKDSGLEKDVRIFLNWAIDNGQSTLDDAFSLANDIDLSDVEEVYPGVIAGYERAYELYYGVDEQVVSELSKKTLGNYVKAAAKDAEDAGRDQEHYGHSNDYKRGEKRQKGIEKAVDRLTKEDSELTAMLQLAGLKK